MHIVATTRLDLLYYNSPSPDCGCAAGWVGEVGTDHHHHHYYYYYFVLDKEVRCPDAYLEGLTFDLLNL